MMMVEASSSKPKRLVYLPPPAWEDDELPQTLDVPMAAASLLHNRQLHNIF